MRVVVIDPPAPVVTLAEAKRNLRVSGTADDAVIEGMIAAATQHIDGPGGGWLGRAIGVQTLEVRAGPCSPMRLPYPPVIELQRVAYMSGGVEQVADPATLSLFGDEIEPVAAWPWQGIALAREAVRIRYRAGYETAPAPIKTAILLMVGDLYRNRETVAAANMSAIPMSTSVEALLQPYRVYR